ncbi:MAG: HEAT repeat domain-containing protein, partial [Rivularia sp. (in: cyanobacteria)]
MPENQQPGKYDAVLGGQSPPPIHGAVLGGIEGIKRRLSNPVVDVKLAALTDALKYGDAGLELVIQALRWEPKKIQRHAYKLLRRREEARVKQALEEYQPWNLFERFKELYAETFANRQIVDYNPEVGIEDSANTAYKLLWHYDSAPLETEQVTIFLQDSQASKLEALIIGEWGEAYENDSSGIIDALVNAKDKLTNLKAIFIGDIESMECEISWIRQSDISPILRAYPQLEVLQ